jgi:ribosomal protein S18 acetylase RimI-like enzyme
VAIRWARSELHATAREEFLAAGFQCVTDAVLALRELRAPAWPATGVTVREIVDDDDWRKVFELQLRTAVELFGNDEVVIGFSRDQSARLRRLVKAGHGAWLGAFTADGMLAGDLGVFSDGEIARYQSVETAPEHRRRGICATLVHTAARLAQSRWRPRTTVIIAASEGVAKSIYESLGFAELETVAAAFRKPPTPP